MMREYVVFKEGITNNDMMDWFKSWKEAFIEAEEQAEKLEEGQSIYLSIVENGDFEDFPLEFRKENGIIKQYKNGKHLYL